MEVPVDWLVDSDPSIRWQVMRDVLDEPADVVAAERARVATEGWGRRLLDLQTEDGQWGGGDYSPKWTSTTYTLLLLRHLGIDPAAPETARAVRRVSESIVLGAKKWPFFAYRGETCITGMMLALGAYFGEIDDTVINWLLDEQLADGGWNCDTAHGSKRSSFNTTISVLEGLLEYERARDGVDEVAAARRRGEEHLLERRLMYGLRSGEVINPRWTLFSFPPRWHYDVLRGLDHLADAAGPPDERCEDAIALVEGKRRRDGRWPLQNHHRGREHFSMEEGSGKPSRWNTLRALRVLRWYRGE
jgi:hypothetical protein